MPKTTRVLAKLGLERRSSSLSRFIAVSNTKESGDLVQWLSTNADHIAPEFGGTTGTPARFYAGFDQGWYPIEASLDVRRKTTDQMLRHCVLPAERVDQQQFYLLKAHAGAGKSVALRRVAWEAGKTYEKVVLYLRSGARVDIRYIKEIAELTKRTVYVFIDDVGDHVDAVRALQGDLDGAIDVLKRGVEASPGSQNLHFRYARMLMLRRPDADTADASTVLYHLQRAALGNNRESQFWYARQLCLMGREAEARPLFDALSGAKLPFESRNAIQGVVSDASGAPARFYGTVIHLSDFFGFIRQSAPPLRVFFRVVGDEATSAPVRKDDRVTYALGFTVRGAIALELKAI